jgi:hypothetical protein
MFSITEAARQTGLTRAAIHKAIKSGRLSATKNDSGNFHIDAAELFRVYKQVDRNSLQESAYLPDTAEYQLIAQRLEFTERLLRQVENERDSLRLSLNQAMSLITHQPPPESQKAESAPVESLLLKRLFRRK